MRIVSLNRAPSRVLRYRNAKPGGGGTFVAELPVFEGRVDALPEAEEDDTPFCCQFTGMDTQPTLTIIGSPNDEGDVIYLYYDVFELDDITASVYGRSGGDTIEGSNLAACLDYLDGEDMVDTIRGRGGNDTIFGGAQGDFLYGGPGDDYIDGEESDDYIDGFTGDDEIYGGTGDDDIHGGDNEDIIDAGAGLDEVCGEGDADTIEGGDDNDELFGGAGADTIDGQAGGDDGCESGSSNCERTIFTCPL